MKALIVGIVVAAAVAGAWAVKGLVSHHGGPLYEIIGPSDRPTCVQEVCQFIVRNDGRRAGEGTCHVEGEQSEGGPATRGPEFKVDLKPGESRTFRVAWNKAPQKLYSAGCDPGPTL
jgi:hypothetical protein